MINRLSRITFRISHIQNMSEVPPLNIPAITARTSKVSVSVTAVPPTAMLTAR